MQKTLFIVILFQMMTAGFGQDPPGPASAEFKIGDYISVDDSGNTRIYFNSMGIISKKSCAEYYRIGRMDSTHVSLAGAVKDYYTSDTLALEANIQNAMLNGPATYYHENGKVRSKGRYRDDSRTGVWTYYYDNGRKEKVINFVRGFPFIVEYYKRNGRQLVKQGNGKYKGEFLPGRDCSPYRISGKVALGKMHGKWKIRAEFNKQKIAVEYYENGKFLKRISEGESFTGVPMISINGFYPNEYLLLTESGSGCPGDYFQPVKYRNKPLHSQFYQELLDSLNTLLPAGIPDQWLIVGIQVSPESFAHTVHIKSSIGDDATEWKLYRILKTMMHFSPGTKNGFMIDSDHVFTILFFDNKAFIPADWYYKEFRKTLSRFWDSDEDQ